jgi:hypothetical protein
MGCLNSKAPEAPPRHSQSKPGALPVTSMSNTTFHYFKFHARGEYIRVLLRYLKVEFTDRTLDFEEWGKVKENGNCEFSQLPMLEYDGKKLVTTRAIGRYVGMKNGLYPSAG